jgi:glyoxylase-like metal-dependent hydrolase (beta-lactamase superfamily II)
MPRARSRRLCLLVVAVALLMPGRVITAERWCDLLPRPGNARLPRVETPDDWFVVYKAGDGVFAIVEPYQFQEVISYLIVGTRSALLFDTGMGIGDIKRVVDRLTRLPVTVLNSHTHLDHVGGNADFERILAMATEYTRTNARGFSHERVKSEVEPDALCHGLPPGFDAAAYRTRAYTPNLFIFIKDGHTIDLGGRRLTVLHVPGHTPDAVALLDAAAGRLFTGDSFYDGTIWLFARETDLGAYAASVDRMAALVPRLKALHPAHNVAVSKPEALRRLKAAVERIRSGQAKGEEGEGGRLTFSFEGFKILTSRAALAGRDDR